MSSIPSLACRTIVGLCVPLAFLVTPAAADGPALEVLDGLQKGQWEVRYRDGSPSSRICLRSGRELIQLRHRQQGCGRSVIDGSTGSVTVQYTCKGNGYGRTTIRRESAGLVQLETQGVADGRPFQVSAEARRVGSCR